MEKQLKLLEKQFLFMKLLSKLIDEIYNAGYTCTGGDLWSKPEYYAHKVNSAHYERLAVDLNLFKDGKYLTDTASHEPFGWFWKSLHPLCRWGGDFQSPDGNHYSIEHNGKA